MEDQSPQHAHSAQQQQEQQQQQQQQQQPAQHAAASGAAPAASKYFALEAVAGLATSGFGAWNVVARDNDALRRTVAAYALVWGALLLAVALRRRAAPAPDPAPAAPDAPPKSGLAKAVDKLAEMKPFGFTCLVVAPLLLSFGGLSGVLSGLLLYVTSVQAMRASDAELAAMLRQPAG